MYSFYNLGEYGEMGSFTLHNSLFDYADTESIYEYLKLPTPITLRGKKL